MNYTVVEVLRCKSIADFIKKANKGFSNSKFKLGNYYLKQFLIKGNSSNIIFGYDIPGYGILRNIGFLVFGCAFIFNNAYLKLASILLLLIIKSVDWLALWLIHAGLRKACYSGSIKSKKLKEILMEVF